MHASCFVMDKVSNLILLGTGIPRLRGVRLHCLFIYLLNDIEAFEYTSL